jgi:hypothetical protein
MPARRKKWVQEVKTVSTFPPPETFTKDARDVAKIMASPEVSPKGLGSAVRMIQYFINRSGKTLSAHRKQELEKAKHILQEKAASARGEKLHRKEVKRPLKKKK